MKTTTKKASVMTTAGNVKTTQAPKVEPLPQNAAATAEQETPKQEKLSVAKSASETAKRIKERALQSDAYEFDDREEAQAVYDKLPEGQFSIKEGNRTVIQKL